MIPRTTSSSTDSAPVPVGQLWTQLRETVNKVDNYEKIHENMTKDIKAIETKMNQRDELIAKIREDIIQTTTLATDSKARFIDKFSAYSAQDHKAMYNKSDKSLEIQGDLKAYRIRYQDMASMQKTDRKPPGARRETQGIHPSQHESAHSSC